MLLLWKVCISGCVYEPGNRCMATDARRNDDKLAFARWIKTLLSPFSPPSRLLTILLFCHASPVSRVARKYYVLSQNSLFTTMEPLHIKTPLLESHAMTKLTGFPVYLKLENVQPPGSFKIRGIGNLCQKVWSS